MFGVSIEQWRGSIGYFNRLRKALKTPDESRELFYDFKIFLKPLINTTLFVSSIIYNLVLLFCFCLLIVLFLPSLTLMYMGMCFLLLPHFTPSLENYSSLLFLIFSLPRFVSSIIISQILVLIKNIAFILFIISYLLILGGIEENLGPSPNKNPSFAVWNLDSLPARDFARIPLIESFQAVNKLDFFGLCETALTGAIPNDDIFIEGFSPDPIRADKADDTRNGGVCLYFREDLPIKPRPDLVSIPETIVAEIKLNRTKLFFVLSYRHPNVPIDMVKDYVGSLEKLYEKINRENPTATVICGDFNARSPLFWENDTGTKEGEIFNNFIISNNMEELINEPTHIRDNGSQSCIDLICTDQPYLFVESGVKPSLELDTSRSWYRTGGG